MYGRAPVDRMSDKLMNDKPNKYAAYHHFGTNPLLQNRLLLSAVRLCFGESNGPTNVRDDHASFNGVSTHENGIFLYQSKQAQWVNKVSMMDYGSVSFLGLYLLVPNWHMLLLPFLVSLTKFPRRIVQHRYFTWHAELLPHTE